MFQQTGRWIGSPFLKGQAVENKISDGGADCSEALAGTQNDAAPLSAEELTEAKHYGRVSLACDLLDRAIDLVFLSLAAFVLSKPVDAWLAEFSWLAGPHSYLRLAVLFGIIYLLHLAAAETPRRRQSDRTRDISLGKAAPDRGRVDPRSDRPHRAYCQAGRDRPRRHRQ